MMIISLPFGSCCLVADLVCHLKSHQSTTRSLRLEKVAALIPVQNCRGWFEINWTMLSKYASDSKCGLLCTYIRIFDSHDHFMSLVTNSWPGPAGHSSYFVALISFFKSPNISKDQRGWLLVKQNQYLHWQWISIELVLQDFLVCRNEIFSYIYL